MTWLWSASNVMLIAFFAVLLYLLFRFLKNNGKRANP